MGPYSQIDLQRAASCVTAGGVLLYPTSTVYGLGGIAESSDVIMRIHSIKGSAPDKPMLMLTDSWKRVEHWIDNVTPIHEALMSHVPHLPITILFDARPDAVPAIRGTSPSVAIRNTIDPFCRALIGETGIPICSTSANTTGAPPPSYFQDVEQANYV